MTKTCTKCNITKSLSEFGKCKSFNDGHRYECNSCRKLYNYENRNHIREKCKEYRKNNLEKEKIRDKRNWEANKDKRKIQQKMWYKNNKEHVRDYYKNKRETDIEFKISEALRSRIKDAVKKGFTKKAYKTKELLGCDYNTLKEHIESQFTHGMTWENHGLFGWHLDHINPCSSFDLTDPEQQKKCFHYTNLQPLWAEDNLAKGDKFL